MSLAFLCMWSSTNAQPQNAEAIADPLGYINKHDTLFNGVGPTVYLLPPPRTELEILEDAYKQKEGFSDSIDRALDFQRLIEEYKMTSNTRQIQYLLTPLPATFNEWDSLIENESRRNSWMTSYGIQNEYAWVSLQQDSIKKSLLSLHEALINAQKVNHQNDIQNIQFNLSNIYLYAGEIEQAGYFQDEFYKAVVEQKLVAEQANSLVKIALIQANDNDFKTAENTIIRKAIPLFNRSKYYPGKILAWESLAKIYQMQHKHTQAQWFLLQARDLAIAKNLNSELAEIEYMLASSKLIQENYNVAQDEFIKAQQLAKTEENKLLQLAITDKLGDIYMILGKHEEAKLSLNIYWRLRGEIFDVL